MLNINTKLIDLIPTIGTDAFAVLMCIAKRCDKKMQSFPSRHTLSTEVGIGKDRVSKATEVLCERGLISKEQRRTEGGRLKSNLYKITNKFIGIYVTAEDMEIEEEIEPQDVDSENSQNTQEPDKIAISTVTHLPTTVEPTTVNQSISINQVGSINQEGRREPPKIENLENPKQQAQPQIKKDDIREFLEATHKALATENLKPLQEEVILRDMMRLKKENPDDFKADMLPEAVIWLNKNRPDWKYKSPYFKWQAWLMQANLPSEPQTQQRRRPYPLVVSQEDRESNEEFEERCKEIEDTEFVDTMRFYTSGGMPKTGWVEMFKPQY